MGLIKRWWHSELLENDEKRGAQVRCRNHMYKRMRGEAMIQSLLLVGGVILRVVASCMVLSGVVCITRLCQ